MIDKTPNFMLQLIKIVNQEKAKIDERHLGRKVQT